MIYLDNAATTPVRPEVIEDMIPVFTHGWANPSSRYAKAHNIRDLIEDCRRIIAESINANPEEIYFTSGGSEANCWAIEGFAKAHDNPLIITSDLEHHSILECIKSTSWVTVDNFSDGKISIPSFERNLYLYQNRDVLVSIQLANNEIGTIQDIEKIAEISHKNGAVVHTDAVQAFGQIPIDVKKLGVDMLSVSGHKLGAPKGIGFLYVKNGTKLEPIIYGTQERGLRGGTENTPYIVGLATAVELIDYDRIQTESDIRDYMIRELTRQLNATLNGSQFDRLPNNINLTIPSMSSSEAAVYVLGDSGICCSAGSACNEGNPTPSHVLKAIGLTPEDAQRTLRFTIPYDFTFEKAEEAVRRIVQSLKLIRRKE